MRSITKLIIHCSYTKPSMDITADVIKKWHVEDNGWKDIGYHYVIRRDGSVDHGRPEPIAGAHTVGHNADSLGICLVGGMAEDQPKPEFNYTRAQLQTLEDLVYELRRRYPSVTEVKGHRDYAPGRECPVFNVEEWDSD